MSLLAQLQTSASFKNIIEKLAPHTNKAYLVGGSVRDLILKKTPKDFDIEVYGLSPKDFCSIMEGFGAIGVGKSFFVYKLGDIDLSLPRTESKIASSHRGFEVEVCQDELRASKRRDFTMNALMLNIFTGELKDFYGGVEDIEQKTIRLVDKNSFFEDSLRALRAVRFSSQLGFVIEKNTAKQIEKMDLKELSCDRIFWELEKIFNSPFPELGLLWMYKLCILESVFGLKACFEDIFDISKRIREFKSNELEELKTFIFLFLLVNGLKADIKKVLHSIKAPNIYHKILLKSPYKLAPLKDKELLRIALDIPLNKWVGICQKGLVKRAKKLGVYEEVFNGGVEAKKLIDLGFKGKELGDELRRLKLEAIDKYE